MTVKAAETLQTFNDRARFITSSPGLRELFSQTARHYGFTAFAAGIVPRASNEDAPSDPFLLIDWPRAWLELYAREGFAKDDLLIAEALTRQDSITWTEFRALRPGASARIFAAAASFGWHDGLLVPIHDVGRDGVDATCLGVMSLAAPERLHLARSRRESIEAISRSAFFRAQDLRDLLNKSILSERERAALALVARGCSDVQIGQELGISKDTSHLHVERAKRRLGATTRAQAVAMAIEQGLIG